MPRNYTRPSDLPEDLTGTRFGRLVLLAIAEKRTGNRQFYECICDCGTGKVVSRNCLIRGHTVSCGCYRLERVRKHGMTKTRIFRLWKSMVGRCHSPSAGGYGRYGGAGITVCPRWRDSFLAFLEDMGDPGPGLTIDRVDNSKGYEPGNCRWATMGEQSRNKSVNRVLEHDGRSMLLIDWARHIGIKPCSLSNRLRNGWSIERALTTPSAWGTKWTKHTRT